MAIDCLAIEGLLVSDLVVRLPGNSMLLLCPNELVHVCLEVVHSCEGDCEQLDLLQQQQQQQQISILSIVTTATILML